MKLSTFRIVNCFGFADSGRVELNNTQNFIYVLGRNSSGKSSLLNAIRYFGKGEIPNNKKNFTNFEKTEDIAHFSTEFIFEKSKLSIARFSDDFKKLIVDNGIDHNTFIEHDANAVFSSQINDLYDSLITSLNRAKTCSVIKSASGNYKFEPIDDPLSFNKRLNILKKLFHEVTAGSGNFLINGAWQKTNINSNSIENLLINQFPNIALFNEQFALSDDLPNIITADWEDNENQFAKNFIDSLGYELIHDLLNKKNPSTLRELAKKVQANANKLANRVNASAKNLKQKDLVKIEVLFSGDGLQVTFYTDSKPCYYSQMSENTKFLFAYHLHQHTSEIKENILIFDEPNNGFHPTAQAQLLKFLQNLANDGNQVIVSTHSEHLIDLDYLSGVRIMGADQDRRLIVRNHFTSKSSGKGDYLSLQPIYDAIGHHFAGQIGIKDKIVITEGITDLLYIRAFASILKINNPPNLAPSRGAGQISHLVAFIIAQGFRCKIILDEGEVTEKLKDAFGIEDTFVKEIQVPSQFRTIFDGAGIEDLFSKDDFGKILRLCDHQVPTSFQKVPNGQYMKSLKEKSMKRLVAHSFYARAKSYKATDFDSETIGNFKEILDFCRKDIWFSI